MKITLEAFVHLLVQVVIPWLEVQRLHVVVMDLQLLEPLTKQLQLVQVKDISIQYDIFVTCSYCAQTQKLIKTN